MNPLLRDLLTQVKHRQDNVERTEATHPDPGARRSARTRSETYEVVKHMITDLVAREEGPTPSKDPCGACGASTDDAPREYCYALRSSCLDGRACLDRQTGPGSRALRASLPPRSHAQPPVLEPGDMVLQLTASQYHDLVTVSNHLIGTDAKNAGVHLAKMINHVLAGQGTGPSHEREPKEVC
jgi:hypothetical protein